MFVYDLYKRQVEGQQAEAGINFPHTTYKDVIEQSGDAVVAAFPFREADTFNFVSQVDTPLNVEEGRSTTIKNSTIQKESDVMNVAGPFLLDNMISQLSIRSNKEQHQGPMTAVLLDPQNILLGLLNPGDWIVVWMTDNKDDAANIRKKLLSGDYKGLNSFSSGLKFIGKLFSSRMKKSVTGNGIFMRRISILATSFSELSTNIYYDPLLVRQLGGLDFMTRISNAISKTVALPANINAILATLLATCLGFAPDDNSTPNRPLRIPNPIAQILGLDNAKTFLDILQTHIGVQKYGTSNQNGISGYIPQGLSKKTFIQLTRETSTSPHPNILYTPVALLGYSSPMIEPFNNVPIWSILNQHLISVVNEMYTTLRADSKGNILPHLIIRQIPFNTEVAAAQSIPVATAFRELPRWKISDPLITDYDTGKTEAMRTNYVQIQTVGSLGNELAAAQRAWVTPRWDETDIERNGLKAYITSVSATYEANAIPSALRWTALVTDRLMGSHLKLGGSMSTIGIQEPIAVGDNLEYDNIVYHIESVEHRLVVNPSTGVKSFSTNLTLSHGIPAEWNGPLFPEITVRKFLTQTKGGTPISTIVAADPKTKGGTKDSSTEKTDTPSTQKPQSRTLLGNQVITSKQTLTGKFDPVKHSDTPVTIYEVDPEDK